MNKSEVLDWLTRRVSDITGIEAERIDPDEPFASYGFESVDAIELSGELEALLGRQLTPALIFEYPTMSELAQHLSGTSAEEGPSVAQDSDAIAIVGIGCRFPGAQGPGEFWHLLANGVDAISEVPEDRWPINAYFNKEPLAPGKMNTRWGGFLADVDDFDHGFFGISAAEAAAMDPQQRLLMEVAWEALEDANIQPSRLAGTNTGVFVGICHNDYERSHFATRQSVGGFSGTGNALSIAANRISYRFDLQGPSLSIDTACSSSLVAVHLAVQSIRRGECDVTLAGGVNVILSPDASIAFSKARMMASDGRCKTFDASADGYVRGEGVGIVVLKRLSEANRNGDSIYAVIRGSAVGQDGRTNGLSAPNPRAQQRVLQAALAQSAVSADSINFVEAHGTGTKLGDPIETSALGRVVGAGRTGSKRCWVGALKSNIGHLEGAAGVAGLIKTALVLKNRQVPPNLHLNQINPQINLEQLGLQLPARLVPLPSGTLRAGVSSFGFGGTNCHVVLESVHARPAARQEPAAIEIVTLSAATESALARTKSALGTLLRGSKDDFSLRDIARVSATGRDHHAHRMAFVCETLTALQGQLAAQDISAPKAAHRAMRVGFLFSGHGSQYAGMARELVRYPGFAASLDRSDNILKPWLGTSIRDEMWRQDGLSRLADTGIAQPAIVAIAIALTDLLKSLGIEPAGVLGHSVGEIGAAYAAGILNRTDALRLAFERGRLMGATEPGAMLSVSLPASECGTLLDGGRIEIAVENSPRRTVLSGDRAALGALTEGLKARGIAFDWLPLEYAFHSRHMDEAAKRLPETLQWLRPQLASVPFFSTATGTLVDAEHLDATYWGRALRQRVRFSEAVSRLRETECDILLEIGADSVLAPLLRDFDGKRIEVIPLLTRRTSADKALLQTLATLYRKGCKLVWDPLFPPEHGPARLPHYQWDRGSPLRAIRLDEGAGLKQDIDVHAVRPLIEDKVPLPNDIPFGIWPVTLTLQDFPWLRDHKVAGTVILPAAAFIEMMVSAAASEGLDDFALLDVEIERPLALRSDRAVDLVLRLTRNGEAGGEIEILARDGGKSHWHRYARGNIAVGIAGTPAERNTISDIESRCLEHMPGPLYYQLLSKMGLEYGPAFRTIREVRRTEGEALAAIDSPLMNGFDGSHLHPAILDGALQALAAASTEVEQSLSTWVPTGFQRITRTASGEPVARAHARIRERSDKQILADIDLLTQDGAVLTELLGIRLQKSRGAVQTQDPHSTTRPHQHGYVELWVESDLVIEKVAMARWLVLADEGGRAATIAAALAESGDEIVAVRYGASYANLGNGRYEIGRGRPEDLHALVQDLFAVGEPSFAGVLCAWPLDDLMPTGDMIASLPGAAAPIASLVRALAFHAAGAAPRLWLLTEGAQITSASQTHVACWQSSAWGLGFAIAFEHPDLRCTRLDLDPDEDRNAGAIRLVADLLRSDPDGDQFAQRSHQILKRRVAEFPLHTSDRAELTGPATCIITGGWGAIGLSLATQLAADRVAHLVLIGRNAPSADALATIKRMGDHGTVVHLKSVDVADRAALTTVLADIRSSCPPIRGVFHAAGVADDAPIVDLRSDSLRYAFDPKALGAWNLHLLTAGDPLEHFVLFSSAAASLGSIGQGAYMAANTFLGALAEMRRCRNLPSVCVEWGPWEERGMAARQKNPRAAISGISMIKHSEGIKTLMSLIGQTQCRTIVLPYDLRDLIHAYPAAQGISLFERLFDQHFHQRRNDWAGNAVGTRPHLSEPFVAPRNKLEAVIASIWQRALGLDRIGVNDPFFELGGDSVFAGQVLTQINKTLGVLLDSEQAFEEFTVARLAAFAEFALLDRVELLSDAEATELLRVGAPA